MSSEKPTKTLSIVMPVYNEFATIEEAIQRVVAVDYPAKLIELLAVDDGSDDGTSERLDELEKKYPALRVVHHKVNQGKGAALQTAFEKVEGDFMVIQDADLEYDPEDIPKLLRPLINNRADVVYGSRFLGGDHRVLYFWHSIANGGLTLASNMMTNLNLSDMETCYKAMRLEVVKKIHLREKRFGIEPEMTAKIARLGVRVYEVPINYHGRTYAEGKKIGLKDAFRALYCIVRYKVGD